MAILRKRMQTITVVYRTVWRGVWDGVFECQCSSSTAVQQESLRYCVNVWSIFSCDTAAFFRVREQLQGKQEIFFMLLY